MAQSTHQFSDRAGRFKESVIRGMSVEAAKHGALNLAQGFPDFPAPEALKQAACEAIMGDVNQYAITWGDKALRAAIASKYKWHQGIEVDPETQLTVVCGATEAMIVALTAIINPGDEVIVTQPFYENYWPDCVLTGATPKFVSVKPPFWRLDLNEIQAVAEICRKHHVIVIMDEIYEHILYDGRKHISMASVDGMEDLSIVISGMSKTYAVTGWRVGTILASPEMTKRMRQVHDFITIGAAAPLQRAGAVAYGFDQDYYTQLSAGYQRRRDFFCDALSKAGLPFNTPEGAYYVMADVSPLGFSNDREAALAMVRDAKVAGVPGSSFYLDQSGGDQWIRFCFCKKDETLTGAADRLMEFSRTRGVI